MNGAAFLTPDSAFAIVGPPGEADFIRLEPGAATSFTIRLGDYARLKSRGELPPGALFPADAVIPPEQWAETGEVRVRFLFVGQEAAPQPLPPLFTPSAAPVRETGGAAQPPAAWTGEISAAAAVTIAPGP